MNDVIEFDITVEPPEPLTLEECSAEVLKQAKVLTVGNRVRPDRYVTGVWWVDGRHDKYRVEFGRDSDGQVVWVTCSCPRGQHRPNHGRIGCSHAAAAFARVMLNVG